MLLDLKCPYRVESLCFDDAVLLMWWSPLRITQVADEPALAVSCLKDVVGAVWSLR